MTVTHGATVLLRQAFIDIVKRSSGEMCEASRVVNSGHLDCAVQGRSENAIVHMMTVNGTIARINRYS